MGGSTATMRSDEQKCVVRRNEQTYPDMGYIKLTIADLSDDESREFMEVVNTQAQNDGAGACHRHRFQKKAA